VIGLYLREVHIPVLHPGYSPVLRQRCRSDDVICGNDLSAVDPASAG
jgi:hypothetical protein